MKMRFVLTAMINIVLRKLVLVAILIVAISLFVAPVFAQSDSASTGLPDIDVQMLLALLQQLGAGLALLFTPFLTSPFVAWIVQFINGIKPEWDVARVSLAVAGLVFLVTLGAIVLGFKPQLDGVVNLFLLIVTALHGVTTQVSRTQKAFTAQMKTAASAQIAGKT